MKGGIRKFWWVPFLVAVGILYMGAQVVIPEQVAVPAEFLEARIKGADITVQITAASQHSLTVLENIAKLDREGNAAEALRLTIDEIKKNEEFRRKAMTLASRLEQMARLLPSIKPTQAQVLATEAVSAEVALVSRLVNYSEYLRRLFETLRLKFITGDAGAERTVGELIQRINEEGKAINEFNNRSNRAMAEFDKIVVQ